MKSFDKWAIGSFYTLVIILALSLNSCVQHESSKRLPLSTFFRNPDQIGLKISPNGLFIAYLKSFHGRMNLNIREIATGKIVQITRENEDDISFYKWGNNDKILYLKDHQRDENHHLYEVNREGGNSKDLTPYPKVNVEWWEDDRTSFNKLYFTMNLRDPELADLYEYDIGLQKIRMMLKNPGQIQYTAIKRDFKGTLRVVMASNGLDQYFLYRDKEGDLFKNILKINYRDRFYPLSFDAQNETLYMSSSLGRDKAAIVQINPKTGKELKLIYSNPEFDVQDFFYSYVRAKPIYVGYIDWKNEIGTMDSSVTQSLKKLNAAFPKLEVKVVDMDSMETYFLLRVYNDRNWGYYYLFNRLNKQLTKLADLSPWIHEEEMSAMKPIQFSARDGIKIHGYLTLPKGSIGKGMPLIINIHSGPFNRNVWMFDRETQFFASMGCAVLQINYRGSTGYGKEFCESSFKQWGKKIQDDITDGTKWAIREGIADPEKIGLYGFGFGGYCSLEGAIREPKLYACVVSYSGIDNLFDYIKDVPPVYKVFSNRLNETIGDPVKDFKNIRDVSPVFHIGEFKVPVFIAQGGRDNRVSINETDYFVKELKRKEVKVTYFVKPNEGRYFTKEEDKLDYYHELEKFLQQNLLKK